MNGLELSKKYYERFGRQMLETGFPELIEKLAVGYVGSGSDRYGFDDEISRDHDFEPGFCIFLPDEDVIDRRTEFQLERAYAKLPKEFEGVKRQGISAVGGNRNGPKRISEFYLSATGSPDGELSVGQWLHIPSYALAEATNGEVFFDGLGEFTKIREKLKNMPEDVRLKRISGNLLLMAQSGQYNFVRCLKHGETEAATLAGFEFVKASLNVLFLLKKKYMPYYKWSFRALRQTEEYKEIANTLSFIIQGADGYEEKYDAIESAASFVIGELQNYGMTKAICGDLEKHAYSVNDSISDGEIRNLHILDAV